MVNLVRLSTPRKLTPSYGDCSTQEPDSIDKNSIHRLVTMIKYKLHTVFTTIKCLSAALLILELQQ